MVIVEQRRPSVIPFLFLFAITAAVLLFAVLSYVPTPEAPVLEPPGMPEIELGTHATASHAFASVARVRNCLNRQGPDMIFREKLDDHTVRFHLLCQEKQSGRWFDMIIQKVEGKYREITAFPVKEGTTEWQWVARWLYKKGATIFRGPLP